MASDEATDYAPSEQLKRSVDSLQRLYTVVVALGLTEAIRTAISQALPSPLNPTASWNDVPYATLFVMAVTLIPFYHGANAYLDRVYIFHSSVERPKQFQILVDFAVLFCEGIIFIPLGLTLAVTDKFFVFLLALLGIHTAWLVFVQFATTSATAAKSFKTWLVVNVIAAVLFFFLRGNGLMKEEYKMASIVIVALLRTVCDYAFCWDLYMQRLPVSDRRSQ